MKTSHPRQIQVVVKNCFKKYAITLDCSNPPDLDQTVHKFTASFYLVLK
jgi:hypothetical protein